MGRYGQTFARIGAGLSAIGAFTWLMWLGAEEALNNPEAIFFFCTALVVWVATEIKLSEEVQMRTSSPNDIREARELIELHTGRFRVLLKETDLFQFVDSDLYSQANRFCDRRETGKLEFQNKILDEKLSSFVAELGAFCLFVAQHTVPENFGGMRQTGFKPYSIVPQEQYDKLFALSREANEKASICWCHLETLVAKIKNLAPEALDVEFQT